MMREPAVLAGAIRYVVRLAGATTKGRDLEAIFGATGASEYAPGSAERRASRLYSTGELEAQALSPPKAGMACELEAQAWRELEAQALAACRGLGPCSMPPCKHGRADMAFGRVSLARMVCIPCLGTLVRASFGRSAATFTTHGHPLQAWPGIRIKLVSLGTL
jgi:hypothetical protein